MRTWRVGTFSMGASLLLLGIFLLLSQIVGLKLTHIMLSWWPAILIILGIEILVFLFFSRQEKPFLKYDILSIFFVGIIGTIGIGFAILSSTGILEKMDEIVQREHRVLELPEVDYSLKNSVKRIVVNTGDYPLTIEGTKSDNLSIFGTYSANTGKKEKLVLTSNDYVSIREKGDTLYVSIKGLPTEILGPFDRYGRMEATLLIPNNTKLEVMGNHNAITLKPRVLTSDWNIDRAASLSIQMEKDSDVKVTAKGLQEFQGDRTNWSIADEETVETSTKTGPASENPIKVATFETGKGSYKLQITNSYEVNVSLID